MATWAYRVGFEALEPPVAALPGGGWVSPDKPCGMAERNPPWVRGADQSPRPSAICL